MLLFLVIGNLLEALLWLGFAATFAVWGWRSTGRNRRLWLSLALAFSLFSISDVIESRTGAWWRPPWLLALKGGCIVTFFWAIREYRAIRGSG